MSGQVDVMQGLLTSPVCDIRTEMVYSARWDAPVRTLCAFNGPRSINSGTKRASGVS